MLLWFSRVAMLAVLGIQVSSVRGADVAGNFLPVDPLSDGSFIWDDFNAALGFPGPHAPLPGNITGIGNATLSPTVGGIITSSLNLYAFTAAPTFTFNITGAASNEALTNLRLQLATTDTMTSGSFSLVPSSFIDRGPLSSISFGGSPTPVNYYEVHWLGLPATSNLSIAAGPATMHSVLGGAQLEYANISSLPEPTSAILSAMSLLSMVCFRRRHS